MSPHDDFDESLARDILSSLDSLLGAFELEPIGLDRFRAHSENTRFDRIFGGQVMAQALLAASATVESKTPHSLHAYFVESADTSNPLELVVERVRDGRSISTRRVTVLQRERVVLTLIASFQIPRPSSAGDGRSVAATGDPEEPRLQDWALRAPADLVRLAQPWIDVPPPLEVRMDQPPSFFGGEGSRAPRTHFMRLPRDVGSDRSLQAAFLVYASDYLLLDMVYRASPEQYRPEFVGVSLDHSVWLYRPVQFDTWHGYTQEFVAFADDRGLIRGTIRDQEGRLVAQVMQEALVRPTHPL
jgi:acyl-CoA thioesterase II